MIWKNETAFFQVQIDNASADKLILPKDVVGLHVTEEMGQITSGSITLNDNKNVYSRILRRGMALNIAWGYKSTQAGLDFLLPGNDAATASIVRRGMQAVIQGPSGGGDNRGHITYKAGFLCTGMRGEKRHTVYESGTKKSVVELVMSNIGITRMEINFDRMNEAYSSEFVERQYETDFQTLARWGREWRVIFRVGYTPDGQLAGIFIDPYRIAESSLIAVMNGAGVAQADLWYRSGRLPNVISYNWQHQEGLNGAGDGTSITTVNGQPQFIRYRVEDEKVTAWQLNPDRIQNELNARGNEGGVEAQTEFTKSILDATDFEQVKRFFDPIETTTAPNGIGYSVTGRMMGTPYLIPGMSARFVDGFPDFLTNPKSSNSIVFYFRKVEHDLSTAGYFTDFDIADVFAESPTGVQLR